MQFCLHYLDVISYQGACCCQYQNALSEHQTCSCYYLATCCKKSHLSWSERKNGLTNLSCGPAAPSYGSLRYKADISALHYSRIASHAPSQMELGTAFLPQKQLRNHRAVHPWSVPSLPLNLREMNTVCGDGGEEGTFGSPSP